jgi:hypothetical protein
MSVEAFRWFGKSSACFLYRQVGQMEDAELLPILDSICPGFTRWAADMRLAE